MEIPFAPLAPSGVLSLMPTLFCGQCFRWRETEPGLFAGCSGTSPALIRQTENGVEISSAAPPAYWRRYFDLDTDYPAILRSFTGRHPFTEAALSYGAGLRVLRQEPWEALCSFLVSQCNHIGRIRQILDDLCRLFGKTYSWGGQVFFAFPSPTTLAALSLDDLAPLRAGYRAKYLLSAARHVADNPDFFSELAALPLKEARAAISALPGVGVKVADCFLLFGLHKLDAFPVDTWMKKAASYYDPPLSADAFGPYAGIAQQYIFYYIRSIESAGKGQSRW